jgi:hypothetical protein
VSRDALPLVDEHSTSISAPVEEVWHALLGTVDRGFSRPGASMFARLVGCADSSPAGPRPLDAGAAIPGFRVAAAVRDAELVLVGNHRFSRYALIFRLAHSAAQRTELRAETRAVFPGAAGRCYQLLVIGSGGHRIAVRRLLDAVRRRSEHPTPC